MGLVVLAREYHRWAVTEWGVWRGGRRGGRVEMRWGSRDGRQQREGEGVREQGELGSGGGGRAEWGNGRGGVGRGWGESWKAIILRHLPSVMLDPYVPL